MKEVRKVFASVGSMSAKALENTCACPQQKCFHGNIFALNKIGQAGPDTKSSALIIVPKLGKEAATKAIKEVEN
ncbi:hypothetical protein Scep_018350 [Stephania cephalantha]|uniref:Uncharacterized protein n=1 Tax=Stephania cephalantha TaxID=152367 RepID=A0AAP0IT65_9MAGN